MFQKKILNGFFIISVSLILTFFSIQIVIPNNVLAQDSNDVEPVSDEMPEDLDMSEIGNEITVSSHVEMSFDTQSVWNKKIPVEVKFKSPVDANYVSFSWDIPHSFEFDKRYQDFFPVQKGQVYTIKGVLIPDAPGNYTVSVNITYWSDTNYISSESIEFTLGEDLVLEPTQPGYKTNLAVKWIIYVIAGAFVVSSFALLGKLFLDRFKDWMKPPEVTSLS